MFVFYAISHAVDDIADCTGPDEERLAALEHWRVDRSHLPGGSSGPHGMVMDVTADVTVSEWRTLEPCCDRVVSAVGCLSVRIFGLDTCMGEAREPTNIRRNLGKLEARGWAPRTPVKASQLWLVDGILPYGLI